MIKKIKHIIKGWYNRLHGFNWELYEQRIKQCTECSEILYITKNEAVCENCWCPLKSKLVVEEESCPQGKW